MNSSFQMNYKNRIAQYNILNNNLKDKNDCLKKEISHAVEKGGSAYIFNKNVSINNTNYTISLKEQEITNKNKSKLVQEYEILKKCTDLVINQPNQNLPIIYDLYICDKSKMVFYDELASGNFIHWCYQEHSVDEWKSFLFQLWAGVYSLQKHLKLVHNDLRMGNVLFHKINNKQEEYWKYKIDENEYYIPNCGYVFIIWDFGSSNLIQSDNDPNKKKLDLNLDLHFFHDLYNRLRVLALTENFDIEELQKYFRTNEELEYLNHKKEECRRRFGDRFEEKYKISLVYYLIENDKNVEYISKQNSIQLPPEKIMNILKSLSKNNYNYDDVIKFLYQPGKINLKKKINSPNQLIKQYFSNYKEVKEYTHEFII